MQQEKIATLVARLKSTNRFSPRHHGQVRNMKKYQIYYNNTVEINNVAEFDTLDEAKQYCAENTKGYDKVCDNDN